MMALMQARMLWLDRFLRRHRRVVQKNRKEKKWATPKRSKKRRKNKRKRKNVYEKRRRVELKKNITDITPDSGAYFNEASRFEPKWQTTFFGSHYAQLKSIKKAYDPKDLFIVAEGVGSDDWDSSLNCRR